ncbi:Protein YOP1 [Smittium culicis]|uniref:Protein YOP1 n=1 Tax=Smittium culicis TaxID=133412 RepID=A0A1R1XGA7_9FUNG|nr:Protein YOP1 [Smittium culicis]
MDQVKALHDKYYSELNQILSKNPLLNKLEVQYKVPKVYAVAGAGFLYLLLIMFNIGSRFLVNLFGFGYAAYCSVKSIESPGKEDDTQWLTYWVVYALFNLFEHFSSFILYWIPFYFTLKFVAIAWLMLPATRGAEKLYFSYVQPAFTEFNANYSQKNN